MTTAGLRIGIIGWGPAARDHAGRLGAVAGVTLVGCVDAGPDPDAALALSQSLTTPAGPLPVFADPAELIRLATPDALAIFAPHPAHYRPAMDALQAGCHVWLDRPSSTGVQEAADIEGLARARGLKIGVGRTYRLLPALIATRDRLAGGALGPVRAITARLTGPASGPDGDLPLDRLGDLVDALIWTTGRPAVAVSALGADAPATVGDPGVGPMVASIRLAGDILVTIAVAESGPAPSFEVVYYGEKGWLRGSEARLIEEPSGQPSRDVPLPARAGGVAENFVATITSGDPPCCPPEQWLDTVRLLEAIARSAAIGQVVRLA